MDNNVRVTLAGPISDSDNELTFNKNPGAPFRDPPSLEAISADRSVLTLYDSLTNPTKIEVITYGTFVENGDDTVTLGGIERGCEDTVASAFDAGAIMIQALTRESTRSPLLRLDHGAGQVLMPGPEDPTAPIAKIGRTGIRSLYDSNLDTIICEVANAAHSVAQHRVRIGYTEGEFYISQPPSAALATAKRVFTVDYTTYGVPAQRPFVTMVDVGIQRIERCRALVRPRNGLAFAANVVVDWGAYDKVNAVLASNTTLTFLNTFPNTVDLADEQWRDLTLVIRIGASNPGFTITWPASVKWPGGVAPTFNVGINQIRVINFLFDGTYYLADTMRTYQL